MAWIKLTHKTSGIEEMINTGTICRIFVHRDDDKGLPETILIFTSGLMVAYSERQSEVETRLRHVGDWSGAPSSYP